MLHWAYEETLNEVKNNRNKYIAILIVLIILSIVCIYLGALYISLWIACPINFIIGWNIATYIRKITDSNKILKKYTLQK